MALVLVIEDDRVQRFAAAHALKTGGHEVIEASDGAEGLALARSRAPALIVCDVVMPGLSGFDVVRMLRDDPATARLPVILLTSLGEREHMRQGMVSGASDYLVKPFSFADLRQAVTAALDRACQRPPMTLRGRRNVARPAAPAADTAAADVAAMTAPTAAPDPAGTGAAVTAPVATPATTRPAQPVEARLHGGDSSAVTVPGMLLGGAVTAARPVVRPAAGAGTDAALALLDAVVLLVDDPSRWDEGEQAVLASQRAYNRARDVSRLFGARHVQPHGSGFLALFPEGDRAWSEPARVRAMRTVAALLQDGEPGVPQPAMALHDGEVGLMRRPKAPPGEPLEAVTPTSTLEDAERLLALACLKRWPAVCSPALAEAARGELRVGQRQVFRSEDEAAPGLQAIELLPPVE